MLTVVSVFMTAFSTAAFSADSESPKAAEDESKLMNSESLGVLSAVGIITAFDDGTYGLNQNLTRADLAVYAARMLGYNEAEITENTYFKDVPNYHWAASSVEKLVSRGIISPDTEYRPDDNATMLEVIKVMVGLAGYDTLAKAKGGYPTGYRSVASQIGILSGVDEAGGDTCLRYKAFEIMFNTMTIDALEQTIYGGETGKYEKTGETMLSLYHDIYKTEDKVNGVWGISIDEKEKPEKGKLRVGDKLMSSENIKNSESFLGHSVICYFRDNGSDKTDRYEAIYLRADDNSVNINADDFESYSGDLIRYVDKTDKTRTAQVDPAAVVVKNGAVVSQNISDAFKIDYGTIELVGDSPYKTVIINEIKSIVCASVDTTNQLIYAENGRYTPISIKDNGKRTVKIHQDGGLEVEDSAIKRGTLLSVIESEDYIDIAISTKEMTVKIDSVRTDGKYPVIKCGDAEYKILPEVYVTEKINIKPGASVKLQFNTLDVAADVETAAESAGEKWAYAFQMAKEQGLSGTIKLKMYTSDGELNTFYLTEQVRIDGDRYNLSRDNNLDTAAAILEKPQIIIYKLNEDGEIKEIDTKEKGSTENENTLKLSMEWGEHTFVPWTLFQPMNYVEQTTLVLAVPDDDEISSASAEDFSVSTIKSQITYQWSRKYECESYKLDGSKFTEDIVVMKKSGSSKRRMYDSGNYIFVVNDVIETVNSDGEPIKAIEAVDRTGGYVTYTMYKNKPLCDDRTETGNLEVGKGDCVIASYQTDTELLALEIMYDASEKKWTGTTTGYRKNNIDADVRISMGYFYKFYGEYGTWSYPPNKGISEDEGGKLTDVSILMVENNRGRFNIHKGDSSELKAYVDARNNCSKIIAQANKCQPRVIVIYNED